MRVASGAWWGFSVGILAVACSSAYSSAPDQASSQRALRCPSSPSATNCDLATEVCCGAPGANAFRRDYTCQKRSACAAPSVPFPCTSAADCADAGKPSTVCCANLDTSSALQFVSCVAPETCPANTVANLALTQILCDPTTPSCAQGLSCRSDPTQANVGLSYCFPP